MKLCFSLSKNIACDKICAEIQNMITNLSNTNQLDINKNLLVIDIVNIGQEVDDNLPRIEYNNIPIQDS